MSQISQIPSSSVGKLQIKFVWSDFVNIVLELTTEAYQMMRASSIAKRSWEENTYSSRLVNFLSDLILSKGFAFNVNFRHRIHTPEMDEGKEATIKAKEIDISLNQVWDKNRRRILFVWEAKKVGDKRVSSKYRDLNTEYINEGMYRFIDCEYAADVPDAGMLGYVLDGIPANIVNDINTSMGRIRANPALPVSNYLRLVAPVNGFKNVYQSQHTRTNGTDIQIHHLFLIFNFS